MTKINRYGQSFFRIMFGKQGERTRIAIDPFKKSEVGIKPAKIKADILLITHDHPDHNNVKAIKGKPFVIDNPGEYEMKGAYIQGFEAFHDDNKGKDEGKVTIYRIQAGGWTMVHLSSLGQKELTPDQVEQLGEVDVLMIPVGGNDTIDASGAQKVINQVEPKVAIPMHYKIPDSKLDLEKVDKFLKVMGQKSVEPQSVFKVKAKNLPQEETKIVVLEPK